MAVQDAVSTAVGGRETGLIYEGDARYPLEVRLPERLRTDPQALARLPLAGSVGLCVPLADVAAIRDIEVPNQISRENGKCRIVVMANVRGRAIAPAANSDDRPRRLPRLFADGAQHKHWRRGATQTARAVIPLPTPPRR
jgi:heavy metal efflux system protein